MQIPSHSGSFLLHHSLLFDLPAVYLPKAKNPISGPGGIEAKYNWQAAKPATGAFVTVTLKNDVDSYV